jgi:hypothetical protein
MKGLFYLERCSVMWFNYLIREWVKVLVSHFLRVLFFALFVCLFLPPCLPHLFTTISPAIRFFFITWMSGKLHTSNGQETGGEINNKIVQRVWVLEEQSDACHRDLVIWQNCLVGVNSECLSRLSFAYVQERGSTVRRTGPNIIMHKPS